MPLRQSGKWQRQRRPATTRPRTADAAPPIAPVRWWPRRGRAWSVPDSSRPRPHPGVPRWWRRWRRGRRKAASARVLRTITPRIRLAQPVAVDRLAWLARHHVGGAEVFLRLRNMPGCNRVSRLYHFQQAVIAPGLPTAAARTAFATYSPACSWHWPDRANDAPRPLPLTVVSALRQEHRRARGGAPWRSKR